MSNWETYPADYRANVVTSVEAAVAAGESVSIVGLSGAGKSNLLGFMARRAPTVGGPAFVLVDGNRLTEASPTGFLRLMRRALERAWPNAAPAFQGEADDPLEALDQSIARRLESAAGSAGLCFLLDLSLLV